MWTMIRAVFWLTAVSLFMPPEERIIDLGDLHFPRSLTVEGVSSMESAGDAAPFCVREPELCATSLNVLDSAVNAGVAGIQTIGETMTGERDNAAGPGGDE